MFNGSIDRNYLHYKINPSTNSTIELPSDLPEAVILEISTPVGTTTSDQFVILPEEFKPGNSFTVFLVNNHIVTGNIKCTVSFNVRENKTNSGANGSVFRLANSGSVTFTRMPQLYGQNTGSNANQKGMLNWQISQSPNTGVYGYSTQTTSSGIALGQGANSVGVNSFAACTGAIALNSGISIGGNTSSNNSISIGINNVTSSGIGAVAIGDSCNSSGSGSVTIGGNSTNGNNNAQGNYSVAIGDACNAQATRSWALGSTAKSSQIGKYTYASSRISVNGDTQYGLMVLSGNTTTSSAVVMTSDRAAVTISNQLVAATDQAIAFTGTIIGKQSGSANAAAYKFEGVLVNNAGTATVQSTFTPIGTPPAGWTAPTITVNNTIKGITLSSGHNASTLIAWNATIQTAEVLYT